MRKPDPMGAVHQRIEYAKSLDDVTASAHGASPAAASRSREVSQDEIDAIELLHDVVRHVSDYGQLDCTDSLVDQIETFLSQPAAAVERPSSREDVSTNQSAAPPVQMEAVIERDEAERIVDALFKDLRDRKFLKWLFSEDPEAMGPILHDSHGQPLNALSADVQDEIRETWIGILLSKPDDMKEGAPEPFVTTEEYNATYGSDPIKEPPA